MKIRYILVLLMGFAVIFNITACSDTKRVSSITSITNETDPLSYLKSKGYTVISDAKKRESRKISKDDFKGIFSILWGLQEFTPEQIIGKEMDFYYADVENHPLIKKLELIDESIRITIMKSDNKIIGGYSSVNYKETMYGANFYTIDGKTIEEFTGKDFQTWRKKWDKKYN